MFCSKCGSILVPGEDGFFCPRCGETGGEVDLSEDAGKGKKIHMVSESVDETQPKAKTECPKCGNQEAFYELRQTRSADESPTAFYTCTECGHKWRDYD
jgi:DNA-directed RNA polymerase subunit M